jgi:hypothetical protein
MLFARLREVGVMAAAGLASFERTENSGARTERQVVEVAGEGKVFVAGEIGANVKSRQLGLDRTETRGAERHAVANVFVAARAVTAKRFATETALEASRLAALDGREPRVW